jgi:hypothetical protein
MPGTWEEVYGATEHLLYQLKSHSGKMEKNLLVLAFKEVHPSGSSVGLGSIPLLDSGLRVR